MKFWSERAHARKNASCTEHSSEHCQLCVNVSLSEDQLLHCCLLAQPQHRRACHGPDYADAAALLRDLPNETAAAADTCVIAVLCDGVSVSARAQESVGYETATRARRSTRQQLDLLRGTAPNGADLVWSALARVCIAVHTYRQSLVRTGACMENACNTKHAQRQSELCQALSTLRDCQSGCIIGGVEKHLGLL